MRLIVSYAIGLIFGLGISVSGMINPAKVLNFFDLAGTWDPSLAFVMGGALAITFIGYRLIFRSAKPILAPAFQLPSRVDIDIRLLTGAVIFGLGWGIAGFCPGAAIPALGTGRIEVVVFIVAMISGLIIARLSLKRWERRSDSSTCIFSSNKSEGKNARQE